MIDIDCIMPESNPWFPVFKEEFEKDYFIKLSSFLKERSKNSVIFPNINDLFKAFEFIAPEDVKVVILGQDPYHGAGQAHGLAFSVAESVPKPPSLKNIFKELQTDLGCEIPETGNLLPWAKEGVLLLNAVLTVEEASANAHKGKGWEQFTNRMIAHVNEKSDVVVFMLWGKQAQEKSSLLNSEKHLILKSVHPSPLSAYRGFFGCRHFSQANKFLELHGRKPINWCLF